VCHRRSGYGDGPDGVSCDTSGFPHFDHYARLISSTPIRNIATVAGNFVNASPIGESYHFFPALDAKLVLSDGESRRELPLRKFFSGYKLLDKNPEEFIEKISFDIPVRTSTFISRRSAKEPAWTLPV